MTESGVEVVGCRQGGSVQSEIKDTSVQGRDWWEAESRVTRGQVNIIFKKIVFKGLTMQLKVSSVPDL